MVGFVVLFGVCGWVRSRKLVAFRWWVEVVCRKLVCPRRTANVICGGVVVSDDKDLVGFVLGLAGLARGRTDALVTGLVRIVI